MCCKCENMIKADYKELNEANRWFGVSRLKRKCTLNECVAIYGRSNDTSITAVLAINNYILSYYVHSAT